MSTALELRRGDEVTRTWPERELIAALIRFWDAVLEEGMLYDRWHRTTLSIPGKADVAVPVAQKRELFALGIRRREPGFLAAVAARHSQLLDGPLVLSVLFEIPPALPEKLQRVVDVLRKALSLTEPLRHLGLREEPLPADGARFTLLEEHGAIANHGAGWSSWSVWQLDLREPIRLEVLVEFSENEGNLDSWGIEVRSLANTPIQPLLDAFKEQELAATHAVVPRLDPD